MIRAFEQKDLPRVMELWLDGNLSAHPFIKEDYWRVNLPAVREQIPQAAVFVFDADGEIRGFAGIVNGYLAGLFVDGAYRSMGVGKALLDRAKTQFPVLSLSVYQKNSRAAAFYRREGFSIANEGLDEDTGEKDWTMVWNCADGTP